MSTLEWENDGPALHFAHANGFNAQTYQSLLQPLSGRFHIHAQRRARPRLFHPADARTASRRAGPASATI